MIIDAMDILYSGKVEDSALCPRTAISPAGSKAERIRYDSHRHGESKTPNSFISACNKFKYLDILSVAEEEETEDVPRQKQPVQKEKKPAAVHRTAKSKAKEDTPKPEPKAAASKDAHRGTQNRSAHHPKGPAFHRKGELRRGRVDFRWKGRKSAGKAISRL